ncbi:hypothetical protein HZP95_09090 [Elizabethkingia anophelis]|nr:hypothetical protein [Elizabethkingia anophelis]MCT4101610.1 hypothetical protein [Elizabethkingia anophelis]MCT4166128.1 hypothetical protein [Elizabethkingia anophelis]HAY3541107.1 hypothetical protein [Elizabethkingia anophelis]
MYRLFQKIQVYSNSSSTKPYFLVMSPNTVLSGKTNAQVLSISIDRRP